jgi:hypothetical protein
MGGIDRLVARRISLGGEAVDVLGEQCWSNRGVSVALGAIWRKMVQRILLQA